LALGSAPAQTPAAPADEPPPAPVADAATPLPVSGLLTADVATHYFFRGIRQEDRGLIVQPRVELSFPLLEAGDGLLTSSALTVGLWNSLHSGQSGTRGGGDAWYESDFYAALTCTAAPVTFGATYTAYTSPNDRFATVQEVAGSVGWDDGALWPGDDFTGVRPALAFAFELNGQADAGSARGSYLEASVNPGLSFALRAPRGGASGASRYRLGLRFPLTLGLSLHDYYESQGRDETFGYLTVGVALSMPVPVPARYGDWTLAVSADAMWLGDSTEAINRGDGFEVVGKVGLALRF